MPETTTGYLLIAERYSPSLGTWVSKPLRMYMDKDTAESQRNSGFVLENENRRLEPIQVVL